ncbi:SDR family oxidoreductase [Thalassospira marina]|uniref:Short-chain dehydrogenase/reductase n=1 Tax=Thalassospira marina TaxID=2048283 RepID=A0A2N3KMQ9_9PROT|nr:SDR family oxidoreductase [Thalassospira marina]PKR51810.1 short-chain dehydrogenase/reductase [Thalassospira marina]
MQKTWFITGTSSGFGRLLCEQLLAHGDRVAATLRRENALNDLKAHYGDQLWIDQLDVTNDDAIKQVVDRAFRAMGKIDVVVNNAGYALFGAAEELTNVQIRHQIDTNLIGSINVIRAAIPHLRQQGGGRILQVSSMGGQIGLHALSLYHTTKWGIEGFLESLIPELAPFNIDITMVQPAGANTNFAHGSMVHATPLPVYDDTPVGNWRKARASGDYHPVLDPAKVAAAMITSLDQSPAPRRLTLGSQAYQLVHSALKDRIALLEAQRDLAFAADYDASN